MSTSANTGSQKRITGYGVGAPSIRLNPPPVISNSSPSASNYRFPLGQEWLNSVTQVVYKLVSNVPNAAVWATGSAFAPVTVSGTSQGLLPQHSYVANNASQTTFTLPTTANVGDTFIIAGGTANSAGWVVAQNAGQTIHSGATSSTTGTGGTATSGAHANEAAAFQCTVQNTDFVVLWKNDTVTLA